LPIKEYIKYLYNNILRFNIFIFPLFTLPIFSVGFFWFFSIAGTIRGTNFFASNGGFRRVSFGEHNGRGGLLAAVSRGEEKQIFCFFFSPYRALKIEKLKICFKLFVYKGLSVGKH
jgi:hypothetical protein